MPVMYELPDLFTLITSHQKAVQIVGMTQLTQSSSAQHLKHL